MGGFFVTVDNLLRRIVFPPALTQATVAIDPDARSRPPRVLFLFDFIDGASRLPLHPPPTPFLPSPYLSVTIGLRLGPASLSFWVGGLGGGGGHSRALNATAENVYMERDGGARVSDTEGELCSSSSSGGLTGVWKCGEKCVLGKFLEVGDGWDGGVRKTHTKNSDWVGDCFSRLLGLVTRGVCGLNILCVRV